MFCPECRRLMRDWHAPGISAEIHICDNALCDIFKVVITRSGLK